MTSIQAKFDELEQVRWWLSSRQIEWDFNGHNYMIQQFATVRPGGSVLRKRDMVVTSTFYYRDDTEIKRNQLKVA